ncbi:mitogen-activated protein kinase 15 [Paragonimus westermani]|uniref:Mitogen-activated protein kinase 15 n=1 Tax=Paragonimus westermani TaxID=34504 RepID=A0A5J4P3V8_9TREM|nr:mitogen-activated protein kinase 15 [Paragonimus westermani]
MTEWEVEPIVLKHYEIQRRLGKGRTFREITFLQEFAGHQNIVKLLNVIKAENDKDIYLVFEFMESDLHNCIKKKTILKDIHKKYIFYQLLKAVKFIHSANVIHRDLKPSNVLLDSDCLVKLCDFGLTRSLSSSATANRASVEYFAEAATDGVDPGLTEYVATRWYRAPEILLASNRYTKYVDMWSLGCILAEMLIGKPLFPGTSTINQIERIVSVVPRPSRQDIMCLHSDYGISVLERALQKPSTSLESLFPSDVDKCALDMVKKLIQLNPVKRLTVEEALEHPYVQRFHDPEKESVMDHVVTPPLSDDRQLSVADYRTKLYEIILEKKAQRRIKRLLRSAGGSENSPIMDHSPSPRAQNAIQCCSPTLDEATQTNFSPINRREQQLSSRHLCPTAQARVGQPKSKSNRIALHSPSGSVLQNEQQVYHDQLQSAKGVRPPETIHNFLPKKRTSVNGSVEYAHNSFHQNGMFQTKLSISHGHDMQASRLTDKSPKTENRTLDKIRSYSREMDNPVILRTFAGQKMANHILKSGDTAGQDSDSCTSTPGQIQHTRTFGELRLHPLGPPLPFSSIKLR